MPDRLAEERREALHRNRLARWKAAGVTVEDVRQSLVHPIETTKQLDIQQSVEGTLGYGRLSSPDKAV